MEKKVKRIRFCTGWEDCGLQSQHVVTWLHRRNTTILKTTDNREGTKEVMWWGKQVSEIKDQQSWDNQVPKAGTRACPKTPSHGKEAGMVAGPAQEEMVSRWNPRSNDVLSRTARLLVSTIRRKRGNHQSPDRRVTRAHLFSQSPSTPPCGRRTCSCARAKETGRSGSDYSDPGSRRGARNSAVPQWWQSTVVAELRRTVNLTPVLNQEFKLSLYNLLGLWIRPP